MGGGERSLSGQKGWIREVPRRCYLTSRSPNAVHVGPEVAAVALPVVRNEEVVNLHRKRSPLR